MRDIEFKRVPQFVKAVDGRTVDGVFSVAGVLDAYNDIVTTGAFSKTFTERGGKVLHLWQHDFYSPPTAVVSDLREISRGELPEIVQVKYPEATGGAVVSRTYIESQRADEILSLIKAGSPLEMSFGYDAIRYEYEEAEDEKVVRYLNEIRLWETSDVLWGANSATSASKIRPSIPLDTLLGQLDGWLSSMKAGARNATDDLKRINEIGILAYELGATSVKLAGDDKSSALAFIAAENADPSPDGQDNPEEDSAAIVVEPQKTAVIEETAADDVAAGDVAADDVAADETAVIEEANETAACTCQACGCDNGNPEKTDIEMPENATGNKQRRAGADDELPLTLRLAELDIELLELEIY